MLNKEFENKEFDNLDYIEKSWPSANEGCLSDRNWISKSITWNALKCTTFEHQYMFHAQSY